MVVVAALMFLLGVLHVRGKAGRAWAAHPPERDGGHRRGRQRHAVQAVGLCAGLVHDRRRGCLLAASAGGLTTYAFPAQDSIILLAVVLMGGIYTFWGPIVAGAAAEARCPNCLKNWGLPPDC